MNIFQKEYWKSALLEFRDLKKLAFAALICAVTVALDGAVWDGAPVPGEDDLRVYVTLDGAPLIDLPFGQPHTVTVTQPDGAENTVALTGEAVSMAHANCDNQDCVEMGEVTRDNLELRVMGGFIVCLPHKLAVEVRQ